MIDDLAVALGRDAKMTITRIKCRDAERIAVLPLAEYRCFSVIGCPSNLGRVARSILIIEAGKTLMQVVLITLRLPAALVEQPDMLPS